MDVGGWIEILGASFGGGLAAGLLGGLLGMGGGIIIVPIMNYVLPLAMVPAASLMHASLVSSLSFMTINTASSSLHHWKAGNLDAKLFLKLGIPVAMGACIGAAIADMASSHFLRVLFCLYIVYNVVAAIFQLFKKMPAPSAGPEVGSLPKEPLTSGLFAAAGTLCSMLGVGIAALITPFMSMRGYSFAFIAAHNSALSAIIAFVGTVASFAGMVAYVIAGLNEPAMPAFSIGYLYLPAFIALSAGALVGAPIGVRYAKRTPPLAIKILFLIVVCASFASMIAKMVQ